MRYRRPGTHVADVLYKYLSASVNRRLVSYRFVMSSYTCDRSEVDAVISNEFVIEIGKTRIQEERNEREPRTQKFKNMQEPRIEPNPTP